jgi:hypothetical protein
MRTFLISSFSVQLDEKFQKIESPIAADANLQIFNNGCDVTSHNSNLHLVDGYLFSCSDQFQNKKERHLAALHELENNWPLSDEITGSFSAVSINSADLKISNDAIGIYPLFYYAKNEKLIISNDLFELAGCLKTFEFDEIGIGQKAIGIENANVGSRTVIKDVKRLLPGEQIIFKSEGNGAVTKRYDNSLYNSEFKFDLGKQSIKRYWDLFKEESSLLLEEEEKVNLALSGGMDSRILLASLDQSTDISCFTYGKSTSYEVRIAVRLAKKAKAAFENFYFPKLYFPENKLLNKKVRETGGIRITSWLEILENTTRHPDQYIFLGDMCEVLPARNIERFSSRKSRINSFLDVYIFRKQIDFTKGSEAAFRNWKNQFLDNILKTYSEQRFSELNLEITYHEFIAGVKNDYESLCDRIKNHDLPYQELYSEMMAFYTHARQPMAQQILNCNTDFKAVSPAMSLRNMRLATAIPAQIRLGYRFMNKMFRVVPELKRFNSIPSSQSPYINREMPDALIMLSWGIRSKIDQWLIKRLMKRKDPSLRYRLFEGLNWIHIYQTPGVKERFHSYFDQIEPSLSNLVKIATQTLDDRIKLEAWPFSNVDLMGLASLNKEILKLKKLKSKSTN